MVTRTFAYYSLNQIKNLIRTGNFSITGRARTTAKEDFGWSSDDIAKAVLKLNSTHWHKSDSKYNNPTITVDFYKAYNLMGEDVYTHFHVFEDQLIIESFKRI